MEKFSCSVFEAIIDAVNKLNGYQDFRYNGPYSVYWIVVL